MTYRQDRYKDPLAQLMKIERAKYRKQGCAVCKKRPTLVGGDGSCRLREITPTCFLLDEEAIR